MNQNNQKQASREIQNEEKAILAEEKKILEREEEILKEEKGLVAHLRRNLWLTNILISLMAVSAIGGVVYWKISSTRVYIDTAVVSAPLINLGPKNADILQDVYVEEGDVVSANTLVARVGNELLKTNIPGQIISVAKRLGQRIGSGETVVTMINPDDLRVVGKIDEDKGLSLIAVGDRAVFTVDAFDSKKYEGFVDEVSPTSRQSDVVFSISDKRPTNQFDVKVRFNFSAYPELKNGMSARLWIYKN